MVVLVAIMPPAPIAENSPSGSLCGDPHLYGIERQIMVSTRIYQHPREIIVIDRGR
jgi:hypothetical protein